MDGEDGDAARAKLVEKIIGNNSEDIPNEAVMRKVDQLTSVWAFQRSGKETVPLFLRIFKGKVAKYVNKTTEITTFENRQFALLMLRKAKMSPKILNGVNLQLITTVPSCMTIGRINDLIMDRNEVDALLEIFHVGMKDKKCPIWERFMDKIKKK